MDKKLFMLLAMPDNGISRVLESGIVLLVAGIRRRQRAGLYDRLTGSVRSDQFLVGSYRYSVVPWYIPRSQCTFLWFNLAEEHVIQQ